MQSPSFMRYLSEHNSRAASRAGAFTLLFGLLLLSSCSTPSLEALRPRFHEADAADFIARYFTDQTSYVVKPVSLDGPYQPICDRASLLKQAGQQPQRELAVILLIHYRTAESEEHVKLAWVNDLTGLGYQRVVFLRGDGGMQANGLPMLEGPHASATFAGK